MKKTFLTLLFGIVLISCKKDDATTTREKTFKTAEQNIGSGKVYSWAKTTDGKPTSLGFTLTKGALDNLKDIALVLDIPTEVKAQLPYDHIMLDYLHHGHDPAPIYGVAHFDMHFYIQPLAERMAIPPYPLAPAKFDNLPATTHMPAGYIRLPEGVPGMGVHWANPASPELSGGKFTETLIYGSYDGKMTFMEPMVALEWLQSKPNLTKAMPLPAKFEKNSYYPMKYSIKQVGDEIVVSLEELMIM
jgi:hypothetical protein